MKLFYLFIYKTMDSQNKKIKNTYYIVDIIFDKFTQSNYNAILASFINHDYLEMFIIKELKCDTLRDYKRRYRCFIHFIKPTLISFPTNSDYRVYILPKEELTYPLQDEEINDDHISFNHEPGIDSDIIFYCYSGVIGKPIDGQLKICMF